MDEIKEDYESLIVFMENVSKKLNCLPDYTGDYQHIYKAIKSRDEEIKTLKQDCKNLIDINDNQAEIMKVLENYINNTLRIDSDVINDAEKAEREAIIDLGEKLWDIHVNHGSANGSLIAKGIGNFIRVIRARNK